MGCSTNLLINSKWHPQDIKDLLEVVLPGCKPEIDSPFEVRLIRISFDGKDYRREINFWYGQDMPLGQCNSLSLSADDEAIEIMRKIAGRIGGLLQGSDYSENQEVIYGLDWMEDGKCFEFHQWLIKGDSHD